MADLRRPIAAEIKGILLAARLFYNQVPSVEVNKIIDSTIWPHSALSSRRPQLSLFRFRHRSLLVPK
mgnify:CR=1 FL=1